MLVSVFSIFSCSKEEKIENSPKVLDAILIAKLHNQGLDYVYNYAKKKKLITSSETYYEAMNHFLINECNYPVENVTYSISKSKAITDSLFSVKSKGDNTLYVEEIINKIRQSNIVSEELLNDISHLLDVESYNDSKDYMLKYINVTMANKKWSSSDFVYFSIIKEVANASNTYWESQINITTNSKPKDSSWVIINDTIGAVLGSPLGCIGGVLLSGFLSYGTNEGW